MTIDIADLKKRALAVRDHAYAPYSKFHVGAAAVFDGQVYVGTNVENASYPLTVCAERNAIAAAIAAGGKHLETIVVATEQDPPSSPCGACRQALVEFARDPAAVTVIAINPAGGERSWTLAQLLPDSFSGAELP